MKKTLFVLVNNESEVLMRVAGLLRRKGVTIKNISMDEIENSNKACLTTTFLLEDPKKMSNIYYSIKNMEDVIRIEEIDQMDVNNRYYQIGRGRVSELKLAFNI